MKVAILAGGLGSRLSEETRNKSKAMVDIGNKPVLWHIMSFYAHFGFKEFVIALGYRGETIKQFFAEQNFSRIDLNGEAGPRPQERERWQNQEWTVDLIDTGHETQNGGRIKRLGPYLGNSTFMLTWCDGLSDVDLDRLLDFHRDHGRLATLTAIHPPGRFGRLALEGSRVASFSEKTTDPEEWINGAYFVLEPGVLDYIAGDDTQWEREPLETLAGSGELMAYRHPFFWQCMDTLKEAQSLNSLWISGRAPWKVWS